MGFIVDTYTGTYQLSGDTVKIFFTGWKDEQKGTLLGNVLRLTLDGHNLVLNKVQSTVTNVNPLKNTTYQFKGYIDGDYYEYTFDFGESEVRFSKINFSGRRSTVSGAYQMLGNVLEIILPDEKLVGSLIGTSFTLNNLYPSGMVFRKM
jgi:hypothetical protein